MSEAGQQFRDGLWEVMLRHRVAILPPRGGAPVDVENPGAIVAGLPFVHLDEGSDRFSGRRRKLLCGTGREGIGIRARVCAAPVAAPGATDGRVGAVASDWRRRPVPLCWVDDSARTIRLLVELDSLEIADPGAGPDPIARLLRALVAEPVRAMIETAGPSRVGPEVVERLRAFLVLRQDRREALIRTEIAQLERMQSAGLGARSFDARLALLRGALDGDSSAGLSADPAQDEAKRLRRLVDSRACAALIVEERGISGLLAPRRLDEKSSMAPQLFRWRLDASGYQPTLYLTEVPRPEGRDGRIPCLGDGDFIAYELLSSRNVFGLVDLVMNFAETNGIGVREPSAERIGQAIRTWLATIF